MASVEKVSEEDFAKEVLGSSLPVIVDFYADWCGPCRMLSPIMERLALEFKGRVRVVKVDTDESPGLAAKYGVRSIPTVHGFKNGAPRQTFVGYAVEEKVREFFEKLTFWT